MTQTASPKSKQIADKNAPASRGLIARASRLWQCTRGVTLAEIAGWIGNRMHPATLHKALWGGRLADPLTVGEVEQIIAHIRAWRDLR